MNKGFKRLSLVNSGFLLFFLCILFAPTAVAHADITTGLVGWWKMDEGSGTQYLDSSGNNYNANLGGSATWVAPGKIGPYGGSLGASDFATTSVAIPHTNAFTVSVWVNPQDPGPQSGYGRIMETHYSNEWFLGLSAAGTKYNFVTNYGNNMSLGLDSCEGGTIVNGTWVMLTGTFDGSNEILYENGVQIASSTGISTAFMGDNPMSFGYLTGMSSSFYGYYDDARVYNRALSPSDVTELYNYNGVTGVPPTLTTSVPTLVSTSTLTLNANISSIGSSSVTQSGFVYATSSSLSSGVSTTTLGAQSAGSFSQGITSLLPNTTYYFESYAVNSFGTSTGSILSTTTLPWSAPGAPTSATAATSSPNQATISFSAPGSNGGSSILYYVASSTPGNFTATSSGSPIIVTGLTDGTSYTFAVYAVNAIGTSSPSSASNPVIPIGVPGAPTSVTAATSSPGQATVTFSAPGSNGGSTISGYTVTSSPAGGTDSNAGTTGLSHTVTGLTNGQSYTFTVTATNAIGTGSASSASNPVTPLNISTLSTNAATGISSTSATLNALITATGGANATQSGFAYGTVANLSSVIATTTLGSQTGTVSFAQSITGLTSNTTYYVRAYAVNVAGTSTGSIVSFLTLPPPPTVTTQAPSLATGVAFTGNGTIVSTGGVNPTIEGFVYGTTASYGATTTSSGSFSAGAFAGSVTGLTCNTLYHVAAYATNTGGTGYGSDQTVTTTSACPVVSNPTPAVIPISGQIGGTASFSDLASILAPGPATTAYLDSLKGITSTNISCPPGYICTPPVTTTPQFTRDLTLASYGPDVALLQRFLNSHGFIVASKGRGSFGNETEVFGYATRAALARFQKANNITPAAGYFGEVTRAYISSHF